ncbi:MAG: efflux RND transporter periplasmic adaptor subunit [Acidobacteria bacterium]|nr:MAG: efflux RND transporter periplasmic adaptor subunit [Acidobacteriota bacterium]
MTTRPEPSRSRTGTLVLLLVVGVVLGAAAATGVLILDPFGWLGSGASTPAASAGEATKQLWTCGMHPQVLQDHPGTCPICGMNLVPVEPDAGAGHEGHGGEPAATTDGAPVVRIDPVFVQNIGVRTVPVERHDLRREIRTVGYLDYDREKMVVVTTKYEGFIEKVHVNYVGQRVRRGEPLFEIYSPELVQTEQELLSALEYARRMQGTTPEAAGRAAALVEAARQRLRYWDVTDAQIERLERSGKVFRTLTVVAPAGGVVMKRQPGLEGLAVRPGVEIMHIADLSTLWMRVEVFENQLAWIHPGDVAEIRLSYFPGETFRGRVLFAEPEVGETTRTVRLVLRVPNPGERLRVGMYADVMFRPRVARRALVVPRDAVLRTGERSVVVVALGEGRFRPVEVETGVETDELIEIRSGLEQGRQVVVSAQFLIDSESSLRAAMQQMAGAMSGHQH